MIKYYLRKSISISTALVLILMAVLWSGATLTVRADIEPPLTWGLTLTADKSMVNAGDTVNITADFNVISGVVSGYSATRITVFLPAGLEYDRGVIYEGGRPSVLPISPVSTPAGTSVVVEISNMGAFPGEAQLRIAAKVSDTWDKSTLTIRSRLYLQAVGEEMSDTPAEEAETTLQPATTIEPPVIITPSIYTVRFDLEGGVRLGGGELTQSVASGGSAVEPSIYRENFTFLGWDGTFNYVTQDLVVHALWSAEPITPVIYNVRFDLEGGVRVGGGALIQYVASGGSAVEPYIYRENFTFLGWDGAFNHVTQDLVVRALWSVEVDTGPIIVNPPDNNKVEGKFDKEQDSFKHFSHMPIIFIVDYPVYYLESVEVDGNSLKLNTQYMATAGTASGSTAIHLRASYMNTLSEGSHALHVSFKSGVYSNAEVKIAAYSNPFYDVNKNDWFCDGVEAMNASNLMQGVSSTQFGPQSTLSRGMVVTLLYRFAGEPSIAGFQNSFADIPSNQWYTKAVIWAAANGIVLGYGDGKFGPNDLMTREQFATVLLRYQDALGNVPMDILMDREYNDFGKINSYAKPAVNKLTMQGVFRDWPSNPENHFNPQDPVARAEVATVMQRWIESIGW